MRFYRRKTGRLLFSFLDEIGAVPILGEALGKHQEKVLKKFKLSVIDVASEAEVSDTRFFIFDDDLVFSEAFIEKVLSAAKESKHSLRFCLHPNSFNERFSLPNSKTESENRKFNFFFLQSAVDDAKKPGISGVFPNRLGIKDCYLEQVVYENRASLPDQIIPCGYYSYDQCDIFIAQILSPFHLLQANLAVLFLRFMPMKKLLPEWVFKTWLRPNSRLFFFALKMNNRIGKNCRIHPTAILEGVELGNNVTVGAYSVIRLSKIGSGTTLEEHAVVKYSVLGCNNYVSNGNQINGCMTYDGVFLIHGPYQVSIFGEKSTAMAVINCDIRLDQKTIQIQTVKGVLDSGQHLLGIAYGHGAKVGGGNIIAPGRIVPNNLHILPPPNIKMSFDESKRMNVSLDQ